MNYAITPKKRIEQNAHQIKGFFLIWNLWSVTLPSLGNRSGWFWDRLWKRVL